jgi:stage IV sporulation protein FB
MLRHAIAIDLGWPTMSDPLTWSPISLGRWFGTAVRVHLILIIYVASWLLMSAVHFAAEGALPQLSRTICWLGLLLICLVFHELGHAATAAWLDCEQEDVHLWPLGNLVGPSFVPRSSENLLVAMAGPVTSGVLFLVTAIGLRVFGHAQFAWNPFGNELDAGAPRLADGALAVPLTRLWVAGWFGYINYVLMLANLLPALPFDGGRVFRAYLGSTSVVSSRDNIYAPWTARACAALLVVVGLVRLVASHRSDGLTLIGLALVIEFLVRNEAHLLEDGGYFEDGVFGYDFSEGYTSLESGTPKVRPSRESAVKRWRRRRSEQRRLRRVAREAAEEQRMDEILEKLHREGRNALTDEEFRFLNRVSARYRNRTKSRE